MIAGGIAKTGVLWLDGVKFLGGLKERLLHAHRLLLAWLSERRGEFEFSVQPQSFGELLVMKS